MAKKSKAKKSKKSKVGAEKVVPTYLKKGTSYEMGLHDVVRALKVIEKHKHLDKFVRASKKKGTSVSVDADTVNFVKDFMVKNKMHNDPVGKHVVNAPQAAAKKMAVQSGDPFKCRF
jgi:signal transduction histidine kinase